MVNKAVIEVTATPKDTPPRYSILECKNQLMLDFRRIRLDEISKVLEFHNGHYAESYKCLRLVMEKMDNQLQNGGKIQASHSVDVRLILKEDTKPSVTIKFKKRPWDRLCCNICIYSEDLRQEVIKIGKEMKILDKCKQRVAFHGLLTMNPNHRLRANRQFALSLVQEEYSKMGQLIECACCFGQCAFDNMAQCSDGHLVCVECLQSYINELLFGTGKVSLTCMMPDCAAEYPQSELARCLDSNVLSKLEERIVLENLNTAKKEDIVRYNTMANEAVIEVTTTQKDTPPPYGFLECKNQLMLDFRRVRLDEISKVLEFHNGHYAESYKCLRLVMEKMDNQLQNGGNIQTSDSDGVSLILKEETKPSVTIKFEKRPWDRLCCNICVYSEDLRQEVIKVKEEMKILDERANRQFALSLVQEEYSKMGQLIECACCFGQCAFDNMAQCSDGHLVCVECLQSYINELLFGTGKVSVTCMTSECDAEYPQSELARCLDSKVLSKLEERIVLENLNTAKIEDLVRCPYCDYAAILPPEETKFTCHRDTCGKVTCRKCKNDWDGHVGLSCSEVETRGEAALRKSYEEKMTRAKVRTCSNCNAEFTKQGGCNRMTCRCGMTMCYICRTPEVFYAHFCTHTNRNEECTRDCCPLWTDTEDDDERALQEIKKEAEMKRKALGFDGDRDIGAPAAKKARFYFF